MGMGISGRSILGTRNLWEIKNIEELHANDLDYKIRNAFGFLSLTSAFLVSLMSMASNSAREPVSCTQIPSGMSGLGRFYKITKPSCLPRTNVSNWLLSFRYTYVLLWDHCYPSFGLLVDVSSGFQSQSRQPYSYLAEAYVICIPWDSNGRPPA